MRELAAVVEAFPNMFKTGGEFWEPQPWTAAALCLLEISVSVAGRHGAAGPEFLLSGDGDSVDDLAIFCKNGTIEGPTSTPWG
jgi:hypothetical protein